MAVLENVKATQSHLLDPDEQFIVAARTVKKRQGSATSTGLTSSILATTATNPEGIALPIDMIWAVTSSRLFIWRGDQVTGKKPRKHVATLQLGIEVWGASVDAETPRVAIGTLLMDIVLRGTPIVVEGKAAGITELVEAIQAVRPPPPG